MKRLTNFFYHRGLFVAAALALFVAPVQAEVVGLWEFENGADLTAATVGSNLTATGAPSAVAGTGTATDAGAALLDLGDFYTAVNPIGATGGGVNTNAYTILMDISAADNGFNALIETSGGDDGDIFLDGAGVGIGGDYDGVLADGTFHRLVAVFDQAAADNWSLYIDGTLANNVVTGEALDGRWSMQATFDVFSDNGGGEENPTIVSNLALFNTALTADEALALGSAGAAISAVPEPSSIMLMMGGLGLIGLRRRR